MALVDGVFDSFSLRVIVNCHPHNNFLRHSRSRLPPRSASLSPRSPSMSTSTSTQTRWLSCDNEEKEGAGNVTVMAMLMVMMMMMLTPYNRQELMANSAAACQRACEIENEFLCRSHNNIFTLTRSSLWTSWSSRCC